VDRAWEYPSHDKAPSSPAYAPINLSVNYAVRIDVPATIVTPGWAATRVGKDTKNTRTPLPLPQRLVGPHTPWERPQPFWGDEATPGSWRLRGEVPPQRSMPMRRMISHRITTRTILPPPGRSGHPLVRHGGRWSLSIQ
jgi:hypothetical protein